MPRPKPAKPSRNRSLSLLLTALTVIAVAGGAWYLLSGSRTAPEPTPTEAIASPEASPLSRHLYSETADAKSQIAAALLKAGQEHKRVIVDFGGDWCGDCQVLDIYLHQPPNLQLLDRNYVLVHVWIGHMDANLDIPAQYGIPINKGVPALAVLDPHGEVVYAQRSGEFEKIRGMDPGSVTEFLEKWKS